MRQVSLFPASAEKWPPLTYRGVVYPEVPRGAALLEVPAFLRVSGALQELLSGVGRNPVDGVVLDLREYRGRFGARSRVAGRILACSVGSPGTAAFTAAGSWSLVSWELGVERFDPSGASLGVDWLRMRLDGGTVLPRRLEPLPSMAIPEPRPVRPPPACDDAARVTEDDVLYLRFSNNGPTLAAGQLVLGVLAVALYPVELDE